MMVRVGCSALAVASLFCVLNVPEIRADIWTAQIFDERVQRLGDETGAVLSGGISAGAGGLVDPAGLVLGPDGNLYVSSQGTGEILKYDLDGNSLGVFATMPLNGGNPAGPSRMTFGPDGSLYVADFNGPNVRKFDPDGDYESDAATVSVNVGGIAFGPDGALYVGDFSAGKVDRVVGGVQEAFIPANAAGLQSPGGLFFLPSGDLLVVDLFGNQVLKFDSNGENGEVWATIGPPIPEELPTGAFFPSNFPSNFVFAPDGDLLLGVLGLTNPDFGGEDRGAILKYPLEGGEPEIIVEGLPPVSDLLWLPSPDAVVGDYDGNLMVEEADFDRWRLDFGKTVAKGGGADGNGNGIVDAADYTIWRDNYEPPIFELRAGSGGSTVPEPSGLALAASCAVGWISWLRRK